MKRNWLCWLLGHRWSLTMYTTDGNWIITHQECGRCSYAEELQGSEPYDSKHLVYKPCKRLTLDGLVP